ncbi:MAG: CPBP family intramembrane metalloprotease [Deltaproteobacteria bacterium]|nr:CPBP family intramembrane metalloprotease [Deltaproteobacteria bacterium]
MAAKSYHRLLIFVSLVLLATAVFSPWLAALWEYVIDRHPEWQEYRYPFSRIFDRFFMISGIILFFAFRRRLGIESLRHYGLGPFRQGYPDFVRGFLLALGSLVALALLMTLANIFTPYLRLSAAVSLERILKALLAAITVGFLEEFFFRGMIFKGLREDWHLPGALIVTNVFYSAIHFVRPFEKKPLSGIEPWAGLHYLIHSFEPFLDLSAVLPGIFGLFLIGAVLSYAFLRTGSLYLSIGLHAGWVFGLKSLRVFGDYRRAELGWLFGFSEPKLVSGVAGWAGILLVGLFVHAVTRGRRGFRTERDKTAQASPTITQ